MKIAVLEGDGIGPEIMAEAIKVLRKIEEKHGVSFDMEKALVGGAAYDAEGTALPEKTIRACESSDAILFGAVGGPKWDDLAPDEKIERVALLGLRKRFGFFTNLRPAKVYRPLRKVSPLRADIVGDGFDLMIVRELTGGIYFGKHELSDYHGSDEMKYTEPEVRRIAKAAFDIAMKRKKHLTCVDKANVLSTSIFFRKIVREVAKDYPDVELDFLYIDNAAMQVIRRPRDFDVMVTGNMFGDILSDEAAMCTGSLGLLASASLNEKGFGLYEPAGGSAPDIAGKGVANPLAQILCAAMMLKYSFDMGSAASEIEQAVEKALETHRTADIMEEGCAQVGTSEMGDIIVKNLG